MRTYFCLECCRPTGHLNVSAAAEYAGVSRPTIYSWLKRGIVHSVLHPSGRKFICSESLLIPGMAVNAGVREEAVPWLGIH